MQFTIAAFVNLLFELGRRKRNSLDFVQRNLFLGFGMHDERMELVRLEYMSP
jgi:hypothetical protein